MQANGSKIFLKNCAIALYSNNADLMKQFYLIFLEKTAKE